MEIGEKKFYQTYHDEIFKKRFDSPYPLRRYVHRTQYQSVIEKIKEGETVLDAGCGEGILAVLLAEKGFDVTACDISEPNIESAKKFAGEKGVDKKINFVVADAENLPFKDDSFDVVISSHVLEHLPNFEKGLSEIKRVMKNRAIVALPTCLNLCSMVQLGGDTFWQLSKRSVFALLLGFLRVAVNIFRKGVNGDYAGRKDLPHLWRYPWVMKRELKKAGFKIVHFEAGSLCLPYFNFFLPLVKFLDKFKAKPVLRNFGYGSLAVLEPPSAPPFGFSKAERGSSRLYFT